MLFPSREELSITILPAIYGGSAHKTWLVSPAIRISVDIPTRKTMWSYIDIMRCSTRIPAKTVTPINMWKFRTVYTPTCLSRGILNAPICSDFRHDPHSQPVTAKDAEGKPAYTEHAAIANTCGDCHSGIYNQYRQSVHGEGVFVNKNPDVPSCTDCHGVHTIVDPTTAQFRLSSPNMCGDCHTDETIMGKYGLSTDVLSTYVADFHGTTVTLFQKQEPDQMVNMPVCYDCHGIHDIRRSDDPEYGLQIQDNLLVTCHNATPMQRHPASRS